MYSFLMKLNPPFKVLTFPACVLCICLDTTKKKKIANLSCPLSSSAAVQQLCCKFKLGYDPSKVEPMNQFLYT